MHENPHWALQYYYYSQFENNLINSVRGKTNHRWHII